VELEISGGEPPYDVLLIRVAWKATGKVGGVVAGRNERVATMQRDNIRTWIMVNVVLINMPLSVFPAPNLNSLYLYRWYLLSLSLLTYTFHNCYQLNVAI
jgi:hypothetical protein